MFKYLDYYVSQYQEKTSLLTLYMKYNKTLGQKIRRIVVNNLLSMIMTKQKRTSIIVEVLDLLYQYDFYDKSDFYIPDDTDPIHIEIYNDIKMNLDKIDSVINDSLTDYSLSSISSTDRAIIRYSVYQLLKKDLPGELIINEAIRITKEYDDSTDQKQSKFTNKLLDVIFKKTQ